MSNVCKAHAAELQHSTHIDSWDIQGKLIASQRLDHLRVQFIILLDREPHVSVQRELAAMVLQDGFGGLVVCSKEETTTRQQDHGTGSPGSRVLGCRETRLQQPYMQQGNAYCTLTCTELLVLPPMWAGSCSRHLA